MTELLDLLAAVLALTGAFFLALAGVALFRMPDIYGRLSATSKAVTFGASTMLIATAIGMHDPGVSWRAAAGIVFLLLTSPIVGHVLGRAAWRSGVPPHVVQRDPFPTEPESMPPHEMWDARNS
ncbi:MAG: monovalent cation/H(+) antiporter subunit G [Dehalococcoidia bacterium]|nr:monovalent cation/H(+) antiporter subunit G [Dehalococcoidia bacterium]